MDLWLVCNMAIVSLENVNVRLWAAAFTNTSTFPAATGHSVAVNEPYRTSTHSGHPYSSKPGPGYSMQTEAIQGPDSGPMPASTMTTGSTANTIANHGFATAQAGSLNKVSSATKGARYDETDGAIDDRTGMQKLADKLSPGSAVGKHTRYALTACGKHLYILRAWQYMPL